MKTSAQYREFAAACLRLAEESIVAGMPGKHVSVRDITLSGFPTPDRGRPVSIALSH